MSDTENRDKAADGGLPSHALFCPLGPMASVEYFGECLVRHNIVDAHSMSDPEGYDGYQTLERIGEAYDEITQHLRARAEERSPESDGSDGGYSFSAERQGSGTGGTPVARIRLFAV